MRDTKEEAERYAEGEAGSLWEPDVGLHPRTWGSQPEPKVDAQPLRHPDPTPLDFDSQQNITTTKKGYLTYFLDQTFSYLEISVFDSILMLIQMFGIL